MTKNYPPAVDSATCRPCSLPRTPGIRPRRDSSLLVQPLLRCVALIVTMLCTALPMFGQAFVAEWNASAQGGVSPTGMLLATEGGITYLYVSDHPRGRVHKVDTATGAVTATFGSQGSAEGQFYWPYGLARDPASGDVYVAERGNHRVSRITSSGTFVMAWGGQGSAQGQFNEPVGVAVDSAGDVYVTDHLNHRVQKFRVAQTAGVWSATAVGMWGTQGAGNGQFNLPYGITSDGSDNLWVADGFNGRVQKFDTSGIFQSVLGGAGTAPGQFVVATWVGIHPGGDLFVTSTNSNPQDGTLPDANNQWVSRFTAAGTFVSRFGGMFGGGPGEFQLPFSAVIDAGNRAYVADYYNSRVQVFDLNAPGTGGGGGGADTTPPAVASFTTGAATATSVTFQLTFSEAVTGVDAADFITVTTGGATASVGTVAGSGASYTIPVTFTGSGGIQLNLVASGTGIVDAAGNAIAAGASSSVYTIGGTGGADTTPPVVATFTTGAATGSSVEFQITFSEPVTGVNGADFAAVTMGGATAMIGAVAGTGASYTIPVAFTGAGTVRLNLNATGTGIVDVAGNAIVAGAIGPVYTIPTGGSGGGGGSTDGIRILNVTTPADGTYAAGQSLTFSVRFSGAVFVTGVQNVEDEHYAKEGKGKRDDDKDDRKDDDKRKDDKDDRDDDDDRNDKDKGDRDDDDDDRDSDRDDDKKNEGDRDDDDDDDDRLAKDDDAGKDDDKSDRENDNDDKKNNAGRGNQGGGGGDDDDDEADRDDDDDDRVAVPYFSWSAVVSTAQHGSSGKVNYVSGSGTDTLTFRYKIKKRDFAPNGIALGTSIQVPDGGAIRDASNNELTVAALTLPWPQNPLTGVIIGSSANGLTGRSSQVIVLKPVRGITVGEPIELSATTSSGLPVTWDLVSGNATLAGNILTPKNKGAIVLRLAQDGGARFQSAAAEVTLEAKQKRDDRLVNLSSRLRVTGGDASRTVIAGFVITGSASKQILVRAIGPGLAGFGISDPLGQPRLTLRDSAGQVISESEGWGDKAEIRDASERVGAFKLKAGSRDSALLVSLAPGAYTAQVTANGNGIALIEVYDASTGANVQTDQLVNISTRGFVDTGDGVLVAGFVVTGNTSKRVLVRGIGPGLAAFGVPGTLEDPVLKLFRTSVAGPVAQNDDWEHGQVASGTQTAATAAELSAASSAAGAFPLAAGSADAAIFVTLEPGSYSAVVSGANSGTGAGLVEVYEIPNP